MQISSHRSSFLLRLPCFLLLAFGFLLPGMLTAQPDVQQAISPEMLNKDYVDSLFAKAAKVRPDAPDSASRLLENAIFIAERLPYPEAIESAYGELIKLWKEEKVVTRELQFRLEWDKYQKDNNLNRTRPVNYYEMGNLYFRNEVYAKAGEAFEQSLALSEKFNTDYSYPSLKKLAWTRKKQKDYKKARSLFRIAIEQARERGEKEDELWMNQQLASIAHETKDYNEEVKINQ